MRRHEILEKMKQFVGAKSAIEEEWYESENVLHASVLVEFAQFIGIDVTEEELLGD